MNKLGIEWKTAEPCSSDSIEPSVVQPIIIKRPQNAFDCDDPPNHGTSSRLIAEQFEKKLNGLQDEITEFIEKKDSRRKKKRLEKKKYYIVKHDNNTSMDESSKSKSFDKKLKMSSDIKKLSVQRVDMSSVVNSVGFTKKCKTPMDNKVRAIPKTLNKQIKNRLSKDSLNETKLNRKSTSKITKRRVVRNSVKIKKSKAPGVSSEVKKSRKRKTMPKKTTQQSINRFDFKRLKKNMYGMITWDFVEKQKQKEMEENRKKPIPVYTFL